MQTCCLAPFFHILAVIRPTYPFVYPKPCLVLRTVSKGRMRQISALNFFSLPSRPLPEPISPRRTPSSSTSSPAQRLDVLHHPTPTLPPAVVSLLPHLLLLFLPRLLLLLLPLQVLIVAPWSLPELHHPSFHPWAAGHSHHQTQGTSEP